MKLFKIAALLALAAIPLMLGKKVSRQDAQVVDSDHIFDVELTSD